ncbi:hypothetical protein IMCC14465_05710 [alpha proteobacterium IMCC14465]|uniref:S-adenosyl-L-methionine-dependent methyltransferase n=1 Tax=alpha proteobacterium IMCC14465 TaxID=1220535 RepID=J9A351_9PROT|nr:hypothetical protein IMCC14465_05710 [alpha proteobacterium IMCC14465]
MEDGSPSQTALMVAVLRAHHCHLAPEPKILQDTTALPLSGMADLEAVKDYKNGVIEFFSGLSSREVAESFVQQITDSVCMRSRLVEERLAKAREQGLEQLVILGAGLDSTAYRCADQLARIPVFEIDHPATQQWKKARLTECDIKLPENLQFVGFDFENQTLAEALEAGGVRSDAVTMFTWLGVQMYLTPATVQATMSVLGQFQAGSQLIMDFAMPDATHPDEDLQDPVGELNRVVSQMGEPFESTYTEQELEACLKEAGFSDVSFYTAGRILDSFIEGNRDICSVPDEACFLLAATI